MAGWDGSMNTKKERKSVAYNADGLPVTLRGKQRLARLEHERNKRTRLRAKLRKRMTTVQRELCDLLSEEATLKYLIKTM